MNKLTRAILVGFSTAIIAVLVMWVTFILPRGSFLLQILHAGAGFFVVLVDPGAHHFYMYGKALETLAVGAIGWFLLGAVIGFFIKKFIFILGAWVVAYVIVSILALVIIFLNLT